MTQKRSLAVEVRPRSWTGSALLVTLAVVSCSWTTQAQTAPKYKGNCNDSGCHAGLTQQPVVHSPVETGACDGCHEVEDAAKHRFRLTAGGADLCMECHEAEKFEGKIIHKPVADGQCDACHDPHGGKIKGLLKADSTGESCAECHDETLTDLAFVHGPAAAGQCTACHSPHASPRDTLLVAEGRDLCFECHEDMKDRIEAGTSVHQPVESDCLTCHKPHGADNKLLLAGAVPELCTDCHDGVAERAEEARFKHAPVTAAGGCIECHDAHSSEGKSLIAKQPSMKLCLSCHNKEITSGTRTIRNMAAWLQSNPEHHGPVRDGDCTACHHGHGGEYLALLAEPYPARFYSPFGDEVYKLCFECHEVEAFADAETEDATAFRNGKQNLHFVHVNKEQKGRTCRACHDPHASQKPHYIADRVPFGAWTIPLNYRPSETGGGCQPGCHRPYGYDRETPVTNLPPIESPPEDKPQ